MTIPSAINAVCTMLREATGLKVVSGRPDEAAPAVYVWPWRLEDDPSFRASLTFDPQRAREPQIPGFEIHFLVIVTPSLSASALSGIDAVREALLANPVLTAGGASFQVAPAMFTIEESTRLFTAASLPLTMCYAGIVRSMSG